jgi:hypothetical protein
LFLGREVEAEGKMNESGDPGERDGGCEKYRVKSTLDSCSPMLEKGESEVQKAKEGGFQMSRGMWRFIC